MPLRRALASLVLAAAASAGDAIVLGAHGAVAGLPWDEVIAAGFPGPVSGSIDRGLVTVAGDILRGTPGNLDRGACTGVSDLFGPLSLPSAQVAALVLAPIGFAALAIGEPGALLANGDRVGGTLQFLDAETAGIDTGRRIAQVPRSRIVALFLRAAGPQQRPRVLLGSGDRIVAERIAADPVGVVIISSFGRVALPLRAVAAVWNGGAAPTRLEAHDRLGSALPVRYGAGFPLCAGGIAAAEGVVLPARGAAAWAATGFATFQCWIAGGAARILLDGKPAWEHVFAAGDPPQAVRLELAGAREVVLRSEPGADGETALRSVVCCHPMLLR